MFAKVACGYYDITTLIIIKNGENMNSEMYFIVLSSFCIALFITGCKSIEPEEAYKVHYTAEQIVIDGKLEETAWCKSKELNFTSLPRYSCNENGKVKLLWDDKYVYLGGVLYDSDIIQESNKNWRHHYKTGDVMELFLKPGGKRHYWELYVTPNGKKNSFFYLSRGRLGLPSGFSYRVDGLMVSATCQGTLNNAGDRDVLWIAEMAVPRKELEKYGDKITPGKVWSFIVSRHNFSAYLDAKELSRTGTPRTNSFHDFNSWGKMRFVKD